MDDEIGKLSQLHLIGGDFDLDFDGETSGKSLQFAGDLEKRRVTSQFRG